MTAVQFVQALGLSLCCALGVMTRAPARRPSVPPPVTRPDTVTLPDTSAITPAMINAGRQIYRGKGTCSACHGAKLEGGPVAPPLTAHHWKDAKGGDLASIYYVDTHGVGGTVMVAHPGGISDADAVRVAAYIWAVGHRRAKP